MNDLTLPRIDACSRTPEILWARAADRIPVTSIDARRHAQFLAMDQSYRAAGGLTSGDQVAALMSGRVDQPISKIAHWIVNRDAVHFQWHSRILLPLFQFNPVSMTLRPEVRLVSQELSASFDAWDVALWFTQTNPRLKSATPLAVISQDPAAVLQAARVDLLEVD